MLVEVALERERLAAAATHERLGGRVRLDVGAQVGLVGEGLGALGALEGLLARVSADVSLQQPGPREALATEGTLAALAVRAHVHREGRHGHVHLGAVRTLARLLVCHAAVRLSVPRKVAGRAVPLPTLWARVVRFTATAAREPRCTTRLLLKRSDLLEHGREYAGRSGRCGRQLRRLGVVHGQTEWLIGGHGWRGRSRKAGGRPWTGRLPGSPATLRRGLRVPRRVRIVFGRRLGCAHAPLGAVLSVSRPVRLLGVIVVDGRVVALVRDEECPRHGGRPYTSGPVTAAPNSDLKSGPESCANQEGSSGPRRPLGSLRVMRPWSRRPKACLG